MKRLIELKRKLSARAGPRWLLVLAPFVLLAPVWLAGKALYWGTPSTQFIPWWWQAWQTIRAGGWPLWNPLVGMGAPLLANYQSALFYPPTWIYLSLAALGGLQLMAWGQAIVVALHLAWAGWGMGLLIKRLGKSELAQTVGGLAFSLSGFLVARAHFLSINAAVAWLPWILLAAFNLAREPRRAGSILLLALVLAMQWLAGHAQLAWYTLLLAIMWTAFWAWSAGRGRHLWRAALAFAAAGLLAFALSAVQLIPTAEYLLNSQRAAQVDFTQAATYSFWPWRLLTALAPNFFGNPAAGNYWGYGNYWEDAIYIGILPLLLAIGMLITARKREKERSLLLFLGVIGAISFLIALGSNTPIFEWLFRNVPSFALFQSPTRISIWLVFAFALLAAIGVDAWRRPVGRALYWSRLAVAAAAAITILAAAGTWLQAPDGIAGADTFAWGALSMGIVLVGAAILNLRAPRRRGFKDQRWGWLICLLAVDLLYAGWGLNPGASLDLYNEDPSSQAELRQAVGVGRTYFFANDEYALKYERLFRFDAFASVDPSEIRSSLLPNIGMLDGIPSANNFDPLVPARYQDWMDVLQAVSPIDQALMLQRMGVTWVALHGLERWEGLIDKGQFAPRARWLSCSDVVATPQEALDFVASEDTSSVMVIEAIDANAERLCRLPSLSGAAALVSRPSANHVVVPIDSPTGGWLMLSDTWYPGWRAFANGQELTVYPADSLFRAVYLQPGTYTLEFVYQPLSFELGLVISAAAWLSVGLFWLWIKSRGKLRHGGQTHAIL
ncbi:MAG: YfhO family protein [Anaerolineales bacterium]